MSKIPVRLEIMQPSPALKERVVRLFLERGHEGVHLLARTEEESTVYLLTITPDLEVSLSRGAGALLNTRRQGEKSTLYVALPH